MTTGQRLYHRFLGHKWRDLGLHVLVDSTVRCSSLTHHKQCSICGERRWKFPLLLASPWYGMEQCDMTEYIDSGRVRLVDDALKGEHPEVCRAANRLLDEVLRIIG